jgi:predicted O-methyltransferase YrrM
MNELINILGLHKENILTSSQEKMNLEYLNMYNWTNDLPQGSKLIFENILDNLKDKKSKILEIGTFVGTSIIHMLNYLPNSIAFTIDRWKNYDESFDNKNHYKLNHIEENNTENIYYNNIKISNLSSRITTLKGDSANMLLYLIINNHFFDFIYVDASHKAFDCYSDLFLSWKLLNKNGILGIDDYLYKINENDNLDRPYEAVNHFLEKYKDEYEILNKNYRVFIKKIV